MSQQFLDRLPGKPIALPAAPVLIPFQGQHPRGRFKGSYISISEDQLVLIPWGERKEVLLWDHPFSITQYTHQLAFQNSTLKLMIVLSIELKKICIFFLCTLVFQLEDTVCLLGTILLLDPKHFPKSEPCLIIGSVCQIGALLGTSLYT